MVLHCEESSTAGVAERRVRGVAPTGRYHGRYDGTLSSLPPTSLYPFHQVFLLVQITKVALNMKSKIVQLRERGYYVLEKFPVFIPID